MRIFRPLVTTLLVLTVITGVFFPVVTFAQSGGTCSWGWDWVCNAVGFIFYTIPVTLSSWILWLSGVFLNSVLRYTVVDLRGNLESITGINVAWRTIRDLANISFIFILLYAAINTILEREKDWKRVVTSIVIAAIFINFSLFFTKLIIDASNIVALTFYNQMIPNGDVTTGLSNYYLQPLGLSSFWAPGNTLPANMSIANMFVMAIGASIFFLITAFVFFAVSIMFIVRYVNIIFLLVLSPIAVLGSVFASGAVGSNVKKWWSILSSQMIFAPAFMIMTWVVVTIINSPTFQRITTTGGSSEVTRTFSSMFDGNTDSIGLIMNFIIIIALAIGTITTSKSIANQGGSAAQKLVGTALGFGAGVAGFTGRQSFGRLGKMVADNESLKTREDTSRMARLALSAGKRVSTQNFDIRSSKLAGLGTSITGESLGIGGKPGNTGGFVESAKKFKEFRAQPGSDKYKERVARAETARTVRDINSGNPAVVQPRLQNMSTRQVEGLSARALQSSAVATNLSSQQFDSVMKGTNLSEQEKERVKNVRFESIYTAVRAGNASTVRDAIQALSKEELEHIDASVMNNPSFITELSDSQASKISDSNKFTPTQKDFVKATRRQPLINELSAGNGAAARDIVRRVRDVKDLALLMRVQIGTVPALTHPEILPLLKRGRLKQLTSHLSSADIQSIRSAFATEAARIGTLPLPLTPEQDSVITTNNWLISADGQDFS